MFEGERVKVTVKLTKLAKQKVDETQAELAMAHDHLATEAAAVEYLIRKATGTLTA